MTAPAFLKKRTSQAVSTEIIVGLGTVQPPHISIQSGRFTLVDSAGNKKPVETLHLDCIVIDGRKGRSRVFWGVGAVFEGEQSGPPQCFSDNDVGPSSLAQSPQSQTCATCVMARWDSDVSKMTGRPVPACKTMKKLALMVPGFNFPFQLRVPVMSHSGLQAYSAQFNTGEFDVSDVITRVTFAEGKTGELEFNFADYGQNDLPFIDEPTMKLRDQMLAEKKTDVLVGRLDVPWQGALPAQQLGQQAQLPAPRKVAAPKPAQTQPVAAGRPAFGMAPSTSGPAFGEEKKKPGRPAGSPNKPKQNGGQPQFTVNPTPSQRNIETSPEIEAQAVEQEPTEDPSFGIQQAGEPGDEMQNALETVFKLPT
jgi:hypothetical protein